MDFLQRAIDFVLHIDKHLLEMVSTYGTWTYGILFAIVFCETGLVVTPFLPGDSLLFAAGALAGAKALKIGVLLPLMVAAAVLGDNLNYFIGRTVGPRVFTEGHSRFFKREHLMRTHDFYERHGGKTLVLARFVPILRTFAPFVAGIGRMRYPRFLAFSIAGGVLWVSSFTLLGYFFGSMPIVQENFSIAVIAVILISLLPILTEIWKARRARAVARER
jgi:membrane-associated protein